MKIVFALLLALVAPLILLPVERVLNYPYIIEELVKSFAIILIILQAKEAKRDYWMFAILVGVLFTVSESVLYISNFLVDGNLLMLPGRMILTGMLHVGTCVLMYALGRKSWWLFIVGLVLAILIHYYFNNIVSHF